MRHEPYDPARVNALVPMLESIANEIEERTAELEKLQHRIQRASDRTFGFEEEIRTMIADAAVERRALRCARQELERLGCSIVGSKPLTLRIPSRLGSRVKSCLWQRGNPALRWA